MTMSTSPCGQLASDPASAPLASGSAMSISTRPGSARSARGTCRVLLGQDRGGHEHGHLLAVHHGLEGGAHGDLGLAVAHVAADQPVHRARGCSMSLLTSSMAVRWSGVSSYGNVPSSSRCHAVSGPKRARGRLARGVELEQLARHLLDGLLRLRLGASPSACRRAGRASACPLPADVLAPPGRIWSIGTKSVSSARSRSRGTRRSSRSVGDRSSPRSSRCRSPHAPRSRRAGAGVVMDGAHRRRAGASFGAAPRRSARRSRGR